MYLELAFAPTYSTHYWVAPHAAYDHIIQAVGDCKTVRIGFITSEHLFQLHGASLIKRLQLDHFRVTPFFVPGGESAKTQHVKNMVENALIQEGFSRFDLLIALGGGAITDLAGYVASTYMRGISLILIPTTLIGMIDAAIGGKNGINGAAKNLFGTFYPPKAVLIDPLFLKTLPPLEIKSGFAEMVKHGLVASVSHFNGLEKLSENLSFQNLEELLIESFKIKAAIVAQDPFEKNIRSILNFGHTFGHAIEISSKGRLTHGESVMLGIAVESYLSTLLTQFPKEDFARILSLCSKNGFSKPSDLSFSFESLLLLLTQDKKSAACTPRSVLLHRIGQPACFEESYTTPLSLDLLKEAYDFFNELDPILHHYAR